VPTSPAGAPLQWSRALSIESFSAFESIPRGLRSKEGGLFELFLDIFPPPASTDAVV
jgi:hypothetical protein